MTLSIDVSLSHVVCRNCASHIDTFHGFKLATFFRLSHTVFHDAATEILIYAADSLLAAALLHGEACV